MADSKQSSSTWWGFSGVLDKVKRTSENIISIYKEDLTEFSRTIQSDTKEVIKKTTEEESLETITSSITGFFGFSQSKNENKETTTPAKRGVIVDRHQARILQLQTELSTYCTEPTDQEEFVAWKQHFKVSNITDDISRLGSNDKIREIHTKLVPVAVSYTDYWERYFYKLHKLNQEEERRAALVKRATTSEQVDEEDLRWDDEESGNNKGEVAKKEEVEDYFQKIESNENKDKEKDFEPEKLKEKGKQDKNQITSTETLTSPTEPATQPAPITPEEPHVIPASPPPTPTSTSTALESPRGEEISKKTEKKESKVETEEEWDHWE